MPNGRALTADEAAELQARLPLSLPEPLVKLLTEMPLVGVEFTLDAATDPSGLGVELRWMTPAEMVSEALDVYPGLVAVPLGFLPVGICLGGSGDPYFVRVRDLALVRIPHDAARGGHLDESSEEPVAASVEEFLAHALAS